MRLTPIIGALACLGLASAAAAADFGGSLKDGPAPTVYNWTGLYFGGHVGWATGEWDGSLRTAGDNPNDVWDNPNQSYDFDGWLGGLQIGANRQHGSFVWGIEADASWGDLEGSKEVFTKTEAVSWIDDFSIDAFGTVRGRLGVLVSPRLLLYGTGGLAWAKTDLKHTVVDDPLGNPGVTVKASADEYHLGWVAGAGGEYMIADNWTIRGEWLHVDLGEARYHAVGMQWSQNQQFDTPVATDSITNTSLKFDVFRLGVNYKFGN